MKIFMGIICLITLFNFIDYPKDSKFFGLVNKKVIAIMKDEVKWSIISDFPGLKSKIFHFFWMVVSVYIYIFTEYIKITAFQTSPVDCFGWWRN